jgi:hypothetical protein
MIIYLRKPITGMIFTKQNTTKVFDTSRLDDMKSMEIEELVRDSNFFDLPQNFVNPNAADYTPYTVTIKTNDREHSITIDNFSINDTKYAKLKELISKVSEYSNNH